MITAIIRDFVAIQMHGNGTIVDTCPTAADSTDVRPICNT